MDEQLRQWDDLRLVLAVGRAGSLAGAARALGVSHPTVFRRVNQIETSLGVRLFERSRSGYALTPAGEEMTVLAERMEGEIAALERRIAGRDLRPSGSVRITTTDTLLFGFLSPLFATFRDAHPEIDLEIVVSNESLNLSRRDADVAIRPSKEVPEELVGRKLSGIKTSVYARADLAERIDGDLERAYWIGPDHSLSYLPLARWIRARGLEPRVVYRINTLLGCLDAVRNGMGISALPCYLGDMAPGLVRIGAPIDALESELWLLTHPDLRKVARIRALLDFTAAAIAPHRGRFEGRVPVQSG